MKIPNISGPFHQRLSTRRLDAKYASAKEEQNTATSAGSRFRKAFKRDVLGGMRIARHGGKPLTLAVDGVCGTQRELPEVKGARATWKQFGEHPCSNGAAGLAVNMVVLPVVALSAVATVAGGATAGYVVGTFTPIKRRSAVRAGAVAGGAIAKGVGHAVDVPLWGVHQGLGLISSVPKLALCGLGAAAGGIYGIAHGAVKAASR